ncbi:MAG: hypothetical protein QOF84_1309 [Streptomyces sp.]|nr:hypothetical protein [Streptomyces sp.]
MTRRRTNGQDGAPVGNRRYPAGSLARRLMLSYALVVAVDVLVFALTGHFASPLASSHLPRLATVADVEAYNRSLDASLLSMLLIGAGISLAVGAVAAVVITKWLMEPLNRLRSSARRLSQGHYGEQIPLPEAPELTELATELNRLAARLADVETRRARLVSDLGHELRTPLTIIEGQLVGVADGVYEFSDELLASVREELDRLRRLTEDLSGLSRAEENAYDLKPDRFDVAALLARVTERLRPQFDHRGIELTTTTAGPTPVGADPDRIGQIMANLLVNALAATGAGGHVAVTLRRTGTEVTVAVTDTGRGIAAADLERIFDRFERVAPHREPTGAGGSGIGLTIARSLARAHGGDLFASSPGPGRGATFTLSLPAAPPPPATRTQERSRR